MPGSGIFSTIGYGSETAWGTYTAPSHFITVQSEGFHFTKATIEEHVLHGGLYDLASRRAYVKKGGAGTMNLALYDSGLGLMFMNMLGASVSSSASVTTMTFFPSTQGLVGRSMTVQVGRPMTSNASVQPFSYEGCKVTDWTMTAKTGEFATFDVSFDALQEDTTQTYAAPSYTTNNILSAVNATLIIGGSVSTSGSISSISGGASVAMVKDFSVKQTNPLDTERYYWGSITKQEQLENNFRQITGTGTIAFNDLTTVYNAFAADTPVALAANIMSTSGTTGVKILIPRIYWDQDNINVSGPQLIDQAITYTGYDDGTNNPLQLQFLTLDTNP